MRISILQAFSELLSPRNRMRFLTLTVGFGLLDPALDGMRGAQAAFSLLWMFGYTGYHLALLRQVHLSGAAVPIPAALRVIRQIPMGLAFWALNVPHLLVIAALTVAALVSWTTVLGPLFVCAGLCYFVFWMLAYNALTIDYVRSQQLADALDFRKAGRLMFAHLGPYLQSGLWVFMLAPAFALTVAAEKAPEFKFVLGFVNAVWGQTLCLVASMLAKQFMVGVYGASGDGLAEAGTGLNPVLQAFSSFGLGKTNGNHQIGSGEMSDHATLSPLGEKLQQSKQLIMQQDFRGAWDFLQAARGESGESTPGEHEELLYQMGVCMNGLEKPAEAINYLSRSLRLSENAQDVSAQARNIEEMGGAHHQRGEYRMAESLYGRAHKLYQKLEDAAGILALSGRVPHGDAIARVVIGIGRAVKVAVGEQVAQVQQIARHCWGCK